MPASLCATRARSHAYPKWREIMRELNPGEQPSDRPDLVARLFKLKLDALLTEMYTDGIFGRVVAHLHVIEFQKRGLPHAHVSTPRASLSPFLSSSPRLFPRHTIASCPSHLRSSLAPCYHYSFSPGSFDGEINQRGRERTVGADSLGAVKRHSSVGSPKCPAWATTRGTSAIMADLLQL